MRRPRLRPTPGTIIASLALLIALGGTSAAAVELTLPRNSVGNAQLKNGAVTSSKVANRSLLKVDFKAGQLPSGPRGRAGVPGPPGPQGSRGPTGPAGPAGAAAVGLWAVVNPAGTFGRQSGALSVSHPAVGNYRVQFNRNITACAWLATIGSATTLTSFGFVETELASGTTDQVHVETRSTGGIAADRGFHLAVLC